MKLTALPPDVEKSTEPKSVIKICQKFIFLNIPILSKSLCKAEWLNDLANEKFKNLNSKAQDKVFKESRHWQNVDKKV